VGDAIKRQLFAQENFWAYRRRAQKVPRGRPNKLGIHYFYLVLGLRLSAVIRMTRARHQINLWPKGDEDKVPKEHADAEIHNILYAIQRTEPFQTRD
jgi:hypothetical protein